MEVEFPEFYGQTPLCGYVNNGSIPSFAFVYNGSLADRYHVISYLLIDGKFVPYSKSLNMSSNNCNLLQGSSYNYIELHPGDIVYKPELQVYFPILSFAIILVITLAIYHIFIKRLLP